MITKTFARILRGGATPVQLMMACVLGSMLGFIPGFTQAPGLIVLLILLLIVLNANVALAAMIAGVTKIISLLFVPLSFSLGRVLLDGPTQPIFKAIVNAPVLALFGCEYYVVSGGLVLGLVLGVVGGLILLKIVTGIRTKLAHLEEGSDGYRRLTSLWWVKLILFVMMGRGPKKSYTAMLERKGGVVRPVGVVFCVVSVVLLLMLHRLFAGPFITSALKRGLEEANGATVDLADATIDLAEGRMTLIGLAMADPGDLDVDLFRAEKIVADVSATSLLRKQLRLDRVVISGAAHGEKRATPGKRIGNRLVQATEATVRAGEKTLDDYLRDPARWQRRLVQIRRWLERLSGPTRAEETHVRTETGESLRERLEREVRESGYTRVAANHLIAGAPRFAVTELLAERVRTSELKGETVDIRATNLSTHPYLVNEPPSASIQSSNQTLRLVLELGAVSAIPGRSTVDFLYRGLSVDKLSGNLRANGEQPISGGTMDIALQGSIQTNGATYIDLPLQVTLHNTTISLGKGRSAPVSTFTLPLGIRGPIDAPRILIEDKQLADALVAAGAGALAAEVRGQTDRLIQDALSDKNLQKNLGGIDLQKTLGLGGGKDAAGKDKQDKKKGTGSLRDAANDLTKSLFGGKKKKEKKKKDGG